MLLSARLELVSVPSESAIALSSWYSPATSLRRKSLPTGDLGIGLDEDIATRPLEIGEPRRAAELVEIVGRDRGAPFDEGRHDLAPALVGETDHRHFRDRGMQREAAFDLDRRHVLAAGDDHVVDPAGDEQIAVGVDIAGIAGEVPAVAQRLGIRIRPPPIAFERFVALEQCDDLAFLARLRDLVGVAAPSRTTRTIWLMPARPAEPGFAGASWSIVKV